LRRFTGNNRGTDRPPNARQWLQYSSRLERPLQTWMKRPRTCPTITPAENTISSPAQTKQELAVDLRAK
jgi:hypothetical protein